MKKVLLLCALMQGIIGSTHATVFTINTGPGGGMTFSPNAVTVHPGDTVKWIWSSGTHTTTSTGIPPGAPTWDQPLNSAATTFMYVPSVTGTYSYKCTFHESMGMVGTFTVTNTTAIPTADPQVLFTMYPNPTAASVHLLFNSLSQPISIILTDGTGKQVARKQYTNQKDVKLSLRGLPDGTYLITAMQGAATYQQQLIIAH